MEVRDTYRWPSRLGFGGGWRRPEVHRQFDPVVPFLQAVDEMERIPFLSLQSFQSPQN
jgi:hypothetical protein